MFVRCFTFKTKPVRYLYIRLEYQDFVYAPGNCVFEVGYRKKLKEFI